MSRSKNSNIQTHTPLIPTNLITMSDVEIDAYVEDKLIEAPDSDIYHIGVAPFNRYVGKTAYIQYYKDLFKHTRDIQTQYL